MDTCVACTPPPAPPEMVSLRARAVRLSHVGEGGATPPSSSPSGGHLKGQGRWAAGAPEATSQTQQEGPTTHHHHDHPSPALHEAVPHGGTALGGGKRMLSPSQQQPQQQQQQQQQQQAHQQLLAGLQAAHSLHSIPEQIPAGVGRGTTTEGRLAHGE
jgi:hypothetical protein